MLPVNILFLVPQQKEVAGVWYRDHEGKQFLKIACQLMPGVWLQPLRQGKESIR